MKQDSHRAYRSLYTQQWSVLEKYKYVGERGVDSIPLPIVAGSCMPGKAVEDPEGANPGKAYWLYQIQIAEWTCYSRARSDAIYSLSVDIIGMIRF